MRDFILFLPLGDGLYPTLESFFNHSIKIFTQGCSLRRLELRQKIPGKREFEIALRCDLGCILDGFRDGAKEIYHFFARLKIELIAAETNSILLCHFSVGLNTEEDVLALSVIF
ncbi:hypothetical protein ES705_37088 [subsurface metagenome]